MSPGILLEYAQRWNARASEMSEEGRELAAANAPIAVVLQAQRAADNALAIAKQLVELARDAAPMQGRD